MANNPSVSLGGGYTLVATNPYAANPIFGIAGPDGNVIPGASGIDPNDLTGGQYGLQSFGANQTYITFNNGGSITVPNAVVNTLGASFSQAAQQLLNQLNANESIVNPATPATTGNPATAATAATVAPQSSPTPTADAASQNAASLEAQAAAQQPVPQVDITAQNNLLTLQQSGTSVPSADIAINPPTIGAQNDALTAKLSTSVSVPPDGLVIVAPDISAQNDAISASLSQSVIVPESGLAITPTPLSVQNDMLTASLANTSPLLNAPPDVPSPTGDEIDIYDPNLTPAQLATLSPGDINARNAALGTGPFKVAPTDSEGNIVVSAKGITGKVAATQASATAQDQANFAAKADWRVRLSLAPGSNYLYNSSTPGILKPLSAKGGTDGVIFPYTPQIQVSYAAKYSSETPTHSNYAINQYTSSAIDSVAITGDFTAQDVSEANYLLAVIHFFRTMTKMFYGQDQNPKPGTPPPLCYMYGMGDYQFSAHPLAITNFTYSLPNDVDYIKTQAPSPAGSLQNPIQSISGAINRLGAAISPGGTKPPANYGASQQSASVGVTWVPTKIQLSITCLPIISRNQITNQFSLSDYASGKLLAGTRRPGGGMW